MAKSTKRKSRRKPASELTKEQAMRRLFPKEIRDEAKRIAHEKDRKEEPLDTP